MKSVHPVLVFVELSPDKTIPPASLECVAAAGRLAERFGVRPVALVMGKGVREAARELTHYDLAEVCLIDHPALEEYQPELFVSAFGQVCARFEPKAILMWDSLTSIDLAPRIAFALDTGLITDCVAIESEKNEVCFVKPVYSSNVMAAYTFASEPCIVTLRSRVEEAAQKGEAPVAEVVSVDIELDVAGVKTEVMQRVTEEDAGLKLTDAEVIVSGGRGMGGPEGFELLSQLAAVLKGAVGASRPPVDLGWAAPKSQVGQTGEKVAPSVYIAVGISGATQHIAGMQGSKTIVAVNRDPDANIFRIADYGVVGSCEEVVPALKDALLEMQK
jgi:electron transfer flavoprotein alpha subunit